MPKSKQNKEINSMTKIYADENIDSGLIESLRIKHKINIVTAEELGFKGTLRKKQSACFEHSLNRWSNTLYYGNLL